MFKKTLVLSFAAVCALQAEDSAVLDAVVVSTTGFETTLKDETRNVYVIDTNETDLKTYRTLQELIEKVPGVDFTNPQNTGVMVDMRGQGSNADQSVKVMVNGVASNTLESSHKEFPFETLAIEDIERVEVIPGGGAVLYGAGTRGGVINVITKTRPKEDFGVFSAKLGSYGYYDTALLAGVNVTEKLFLKAGGKIFGEKNFRQDEKSNGYYVTGTANYQLDENQEIAINSSFYKVSDVGIDSLTYEQLKADRRQNPYPDSLSDGKMKKFDINAEYKGRFGAWSVDILPYHQRFEHTSHVQYYGYLNSDGGFKDRKTGVKAKAKYDYDTGSLIFGYDYLHNTTWRSSDYNFLMMGKNYHMSWINIKGNKDTHSLYFLEKQEFGSAFDVSLGYRFEYADYDMNREKLSGFDGMLVSEPQMDGGQFDEKNHAFEITPNFKYSDTGNVYFKFERGFISPTPYQKIDKSVTGEYSINDVKSEKYNTYEIGMKDSLWGQFVSATVFYTDSKDEILYIMGPGHSTYWNYYNVDKTERFGVELRAEQKLFNDKLTLSESYSYIRPKIKSGDNDGKDITHVSRNKFVFGVKYEPIQELDLWADYKFYSKQYDSGYDRIKARNIVDVGASFEVAKGLTVGASVMNVFDNKYNEYQHKANDSYVPAKGRTFYGEIKYKF